MRMIRRRTPSAWRWRAPLALVLLTATSSADPVVDYRSGLIALRGSSGVGGPVFMQMHVSPDGRHVYVLAAGSYLSTHSRDEETGLVSPVGDPITLPGYGAVALSPDGAHLYASVGPSTLQVYALDADTGVPSLVGSSDVGSAGGLAVSPDGAFVYLKSGSTILALSRDALSGELGAPAEVATSSGPDFAISPDGAHLYVVGGNSRPEIDVHARDANTGALTLLETLVQGENGVDGLPAGDIAISPDGRDVYVGGSSTLAVFARDASTGLLDFDDATEIGSGGASLAPGNGFVWVLQYFASVKDLGPISVKAFARGEGSDALSLLDDVSTAWEDFYYGGPVTPGGGSDIALAPDSWDAYFGGDVDAKVRTATLAPTSGLLDEIQSTTDASLQGALDAFVTPDGRHVVVLADAPAGLAVFARDPATGLVAPVEVETALLGQPSDAAASPDGRFVYVADRVAGVVRFERTPASGALTAIDATASGLTSGADALELDTTGTRLYAGGHDAGEVALYARDEANGALAHIETVAIGQVRALSLAPQDAFLYVDRSYELSYPGSTWAHAIDPIDGTIDATGTELGRSIATASRDGAHFYQIGPWFEDSCPVGPHVTCPQEIRTAELDVATGGPGALLAATRDEPLVAAGRVTRMALSRDGRFLYASRGAPSPLSEALRSCLVAFARDSASGALTYSDAECAPVSTFAIAPSGEHLYAVDADAGTLRVYAPEPGAVALAIAGIAVLATLAGLRSRTA